MMQGDKEFEGCIFYVTGEGFGKSARRCKILRQVHALGRTEECWVVDAYPPIAGVSPDSTVVIVNRSMKASLRNVGPNTGLPVQIFISPNPDDGSTTFAYQNFIKLGDGALYQQVPDYMFPFKIEE